MAKLLQSSSGSIRSYEIEKLCPEGTFPAVCPDIMESFGVEEPSYDNPAVMVTKDKLRPLFACNVNGEVFLVQPYEFNISGSPKSKLYGFIKSWLGKAPAPGFDTEDLIGKCCQVTVSHKTSKKGTVYATIDAIAPLMDESLAPKLPEIDVPGGKRSVSPETEESEGAGTDPF